MYKLPFRGVDGQPPPFFYRRRISGLAVIGLLIAGALAVGLLIIVMGLRIVSKPAPPSEPVELTQTQQDILDQRDQNTLDKLRVKNVWIKNSMYVYIGTIAGILLLVGIPVGIKFSRPVIVAVRNDPETGKEQTVFSIPVTPDTQFFLGQLGQSLVEGASTENLMNVEGIVQSRVKQGLDLVRAMPKLSGLGRPANVQYDAAALPPPEQSPERQMVQSRRTLFLRDVWPHIKRDEVVLGEAMSGRELSGGTATEDCPDRFAFHPQIRIPLSKKNAESVLIIGGTDIGKTSLLAVIIAQFVWQKARVSVLDPHFDPQGKNSEAALTRTEHINPLLYRIVTLREYLDTYGLEILVEADNEITRRLALPEEALEKEPLWVTIVEEYNDIANACPEAIDYVDAILRNGRKVGVCVVMVSHKVNMSNLPFHGLIGSRIVFQSEKKAANHILGNKSVADRCWDELDVGEAVIYTRKKRYDWIKFKAYFLEAGDLKELIDVPEEAVRAYRRTDMIYSGTLDQAEEAIPIEHWKLAEDSHVARSRLRILREGGKTPVTYQDLVAAAENPEVTLSQVKKYLSPKDSNRPVNGFTDTFYASMFKALWQTEYPLTREEEETEQHGD